MKQQSSNREFRFSTIILPWVVCCLGAIFYCYEFFLRAAPSVMVPQMMAAYGIDAKTLGIMAAAYYYIYTPMQLPVGVLMDRYGPRRLLTVAIFVCLLGSFLIATVLNVYSASLARFLMGFGSSFAFVGVLKLAVHWLPANRLALVTGITTALGMVGGIVADDLLSNIVNTFGWRESWLYAGMIGVVLLLVVGLVVRDNPPHKQTKIIKRETRTWKQAIYYFMRVIKNPQIWLVGIIGTCMFMPIDVFGVLWGVSFISEAQHISTVQAGYTISMVFWGFAVGGPMMGWLSDFIKQRRIILMSGAVVAVLLFLILFFVPNLSLLNVYILLFIIGFFCSAQVLVFAIACENGPQKASGTAVASTNFLVTLGTMIFQPVIGWILSLDKTAPVVNKVHLYSYVDYQHALLVLPIALGLGIICSFFIKETYCQPYPKEDFEVFWQNKNLSVAV